MATNLVRFEAGNGPRWGVVTGRRSLLSGDYPTTAALIERGEADWREARSRSARIAMASAKILSPVTTPCRLYCQGANYRQHMVESGMDPDAKLFNMFFTKADASVSSGREKVTRPAHVKLLDYEIELALVFRRPISSAVTVTRETLPDYVFAITIANDLSAATCSCRKPSSSRAKLPRLLPDRPVAHGAGTRRVSRIDDLALELDVNGAPRQRDTTANLVFKPAETISELSTFADIRPGDVLLTGTPNGCALRVPPPPVRRLLQVLPERVLWKLFLNGQARRPQYLKPSDRITARIRSRDRAFDLGEQVTEIVGP
jgi:2-keto-4-pentenoate hydratase/2-oxohepta-3-ene-1,7-dioic acid hydratase in catechol pathway